MANSEKYFTPDEKDRFQFEIFDQKLAFNEDFEAIVKILRGRYVAKSENFIIRGISIVFWAAGIQSILGINAESGLLEYFGCLFCFVAGIGFIYFGDTFISCVGPLKRIFWSVDKKNIQKIELVAEKDHFHTNYRIYITAENKEFIIPIGNRLIYHIERLSGKPVEHFAIRVKYSSPQVTFKNLMYFLFILTIAVAAVALIISLLVMAGYL